MRLPLHPKWKGTSLQDMFNDQPLSRFRPIIRVFVSSTFSDLKHERNALQDRVWPVLEQHCRLHGFQFQAIDLRWGVSTEAGLDHRTMRICMDELRRSQEISPLPNFLILLGDRYGWQPLPEEITPIEFAELQKAATGTRLALKVLKTWYRHDTNAIPVVCLLRSRLESPDGRDYTRDGKGNDTAAWKRVQKVLWSIVNRAYPVANLVHRFESFFGNEILRNAGTPSIVRFQGSATEQEIWNGAFRIPNAAQHVVAFDRTIHNLEAFARHERLKDFVNVDDSGKIREDLLAAVQTLKQRLRGILGENHVAAPKSVSLVAVVDDQGKSRLDIAAEDRPDLIDALCQHVLGRLKPIIQQQMDEFNRVPETGGTAPLSPEVLRDLKRERDLHQRFAAERAPSGVFVGRILELAKIQAYLAGENDRPFVVHGVSGSGKTALLAQAARDAKHTTAILIERFLGITKRSSDLRSLLIDLCQTLREQFPLAEELPADVRLLEREFYEQIKNATAERPIYIFLDALDQLDATDGAHSLSWIRSTPLPPYAKLVVSCLSDPDDDVAGRPYAVLKQRGFLTAANSVGIIELTLDEAKVLLQRWLNQVGRKLNEKQQTNVDARILSTKQVDTACRQPLYLKILFEEARLWRSFDEPIEPAATVPGLLASLFDRLCRRAAHGPLVSPAMAYLVSARYGLAENEILEVLYCDPDYKQQLLDSAQHQLPANARRIPIAIWSRLRYDLSSYLAERGAPGGTVLNFYHRQVGNFVRQRFADDKSRSTTHARLAAYFEDQDFFLESLEEQRARAKRLPPTPRPVNIRMVYELPWQLLEVAKLSGKDDPKSPHWDAVADLFTDLRFLEAKAEAAE